MSWTADSTQITADQTCWTADGYNGCDLDLGGGGGMDVTDTDKQTISLIQKDFRKDTFNASLDAFLVKQEAIDESFSKSAGIDKTDSMDIIRATTLARFDVLVESIGEDEVDELIESDEEGLITFLLLM